MKSILIGQGHVYHSRKEGAENSFRYPTFFLQVPCRQEDRFKEILRSRYYGALSFSATDYLRGNEGRLEENIQNFLREMCSYEADEVSLQTMPRMFGYAFNPVSFWFCRRQGSLEAVLVEVNNTFGERHFYWIHPRGGITDSLWMRAEKVFHVSPFFPVEGYYQFRFRLNAEESRVDINFHGPDEKLRLATWVTGKLSEFGGDSLWSLLARYGWMTPMVVLRIHYQAVRLWLKKMRFYRKPALPDKEVSS